MEGAIAYATVSSETDTNGEHPAPLPKAILEGSEHYRTRLPVGYERICECKANHINCLTAKEWLKSQLGVWQFNYEKRDVRDKKLHPATFPLSLSRKVIELFSHEGENGTRSVRGERDCSGRGPGYEPERRGVRPVAGVRRA